MLKEIKIGWRKYDIEICAKDKRKLLISTNDCYGEISHDDRVIRLNADNSNEQSKCTLIHEVLHGIEHMYSINELKEEHTIKRLADALYTVLVDNNLEIVKKESI